MNADGMSDRELLVRLDERVAKLLEWTEGHEKRHAKADGRTFAYVLATFSALVAAALAWLLR